MQMNGTGGSMGIPQEMRDAMEQQQAQKNARARRENGEPPVDNIKEVDSTHPDLETKSEESTDTKEAPHKEVGAKQIFKRLGIELGEEDIQKIIFKGYVEKEVSIVEKYLKAKLKTLTTEEYNLVDEVIADEAKNSDMSVDGYNARKSVLTVACGLVELNGKPVIKKVPKEDDGSVDLKKYMLLKRQVLDKMSGSVVDKLIESHGAFSLGVNMAIRNPEDLLKNS